MKKLGTSASVVEQLPTAEMSPKTLLAQIMEWADEIEHLVIVTWSDHGVRTHWTDMKSSELLLCAERLKEEAMRRYHEPDDG